MLQSAIMGADLAVAIKRNLQGALINTASARAADSIRPRQVARPHRQGHCPRAHGAPTPPAATN
jgi:hypothetical protein